MKDWIFAILLLAIHLFVAHLADLYGVLCPLLLLVIDFLIYAHLTKDQNGELQPEPFQDDRILDADYDSLR